MKKFLTGLTATKRKKAILLIIIVLIVLAAVRIIVTNNSNKAEVVSDVINIKVTDVVKTTLETTAPLTGRISPVKEVSVMPLLAGQVQNVYVELGDKVSSGTVLFDIDKTQIETAYTQANEAYLNAKANYERMQTLFSAGAISKQEFEAIKLQYDTALQSKIMAGDSLSNATVTAPIGGYVTSVNVTSGGLASQAAAAVTIADISTVEINTSVSEQLINKIKLNDKVDVLIPSVSEKKFVGTITALSPAPAVNSLTYPLKVTLDNADAMIKPGMTAEITVVSDKNENAIVIPSNAVMIRGGKTIAAVLSADNKVILKEISVGIDNGTEAEVVTGLSEGEKVVIEGQQYIDEESKVKIIE